MRKCFLSQINIQLAYNYNGASGIAVVQPKLLDGLAFLTKTLLLLSYLFFRSFNNTIDVYVTWWQSRKTDRIKTSV